MGVAVDGSSSVQLCPVLVAAVRASAIVCSYYCLTHSPRPLTPALSWLLLALHLVAQAQAQAQALFLAGLAQ
jgi:hypothetical protein